MAERNVSENNVGKVVEVKGVVVDAVFTGALPGIYNALRITVPGQDGSPGRDLIAEVQQHLGDNRVRAVAMDSTDGLPRGVDVVDTGAPISVPVGKETLGRVFNLLGEPIDNGEPLPPASAGRSTAIRRRSASCRRRPRSSRRASRSSTCSPRSSAAARSACSAAPGSARRC